MQPNAFFLNCDFRVIMAGMDSCAGDMFISTICDFIDQFTGFTKTSNITRVNAIYSSSTGTVTSGYWRRGKKREELKSFGAKVCELGKGGGGIVFFCMRVKVTHNKVLLVGTIGEGHQAI